MGDDDAMLDVVASANIASGFHAGDPAIMRRTCALAVEKGVRIEAHVGYRDLAGFGRRTMVVAPDELAGGGYGAQRGLPGWKEGIAEPPARAPGFFGLLTVRCVIRRFHAPHPLERVAGREWSTGHTPSTVGPPPLSIRPVRGD